MKDHTVAKLVNALTKKAISQKDCMSMRQALSAIVVKYTNKDSKSMFVFEGVRNTGRANWIPNK